MAMILLTLLLLASGFQVVIILMQHGRGGGLAGAIGNSGGHGALGTRAGDIFTVVTIVSTIVWISLACVTGWWIRG
jgi:preprotein translocase subunit SecG